MDAVPETERELLLAVDVKAIRVGGRALVRVAAPVSSSAGTPAGMVTPWKVDGVD